MDSDTTYTADTFDRLTVAEAAERLGVTDNAIRQRIRRGSIQHDRDADGLTYVYLRPEDTPRDGNERVQGTSRDASRDDLIEELREQNRRLWQELQDRAEELRRRDHIIMSLTQRIPELEPVQHEAAPDEPQAPETAPERTEGVDTLVDATGAQEEAVQRRSWWRRLFGG